MSADFVAIASHLALEAGRRLMELRLTDLVKERKADRSLVTNADRDADAIIRSGLHAHFPSHTVLTEESGIEGDPNNEFVWMVDPMDGTRAYVKGTAGFSVMIGLLKKGTPYAGVVYDPWEEHLYEATRGSGTFHTLKGQRQRLQVSERREWTAMPLVTSTDFPPQIREAIQRTVSCPSVPSINSVGIKVGLLVRQQADIYVNHHAVHYWDTLGPQVILEEAGGTITFSNGKPLLYDLSKGLRHDSPTIASNNQRHAELIDKLGPLTSSTVTRQPSADKRD